MEVPVPVAEQVLREHGPTWVVIIATFGLFLWSFRRLFTHVLDQWKAFTSFMDATVKALNSNREAITELRASIQENQREIVHQMELMQQFFAREQGTPTGPVNIGSRKRGE